MVHDHMRNNGIPVMFTDLDLVGCDNRLLIIAPIELHNQILSCLKSIKWVPDFILNDLVLLGNDHDSSEK